MIDNYLDVIILSKLLKNDLTSYNIYYRINMFKEIKMVYIYLCLKELIKDKLITSYFIEDNNIRRKYYKISGRGKDYLKAFLKEKNILDNLLGDANGK